MAEITGYLESRAQRIDSNVRIGYIAGTLEALQVQITDIMAHDEGEISGSELRIAISKMEEPITRCIRELYMIVEQKKQVPTRG